MQELLRSNDPVRLSFIIALLRDEGIDAILADLNTSILEGSIGAIPRRLLVHGEDIGRARQILRAAGELPLDA